MGGYPPPSGFPQVPKNTMGRGAAVLDCLVTSFAEVSLARANSHERGASDPLPTWPDLAVGQVTWCCRGWRTAAACSAPCSILWCGSAAEEPTLCCTMTSSTTSTACWTAPNGSFSLMWWVSEWLTADIVDAAVFYYRALFSCFWLERMRNTRPGVG